MALAIAPPLSDTHPPRKTWTRAELDALDAAGLLAGTLLELIEGEIYDKMGQNPPHASAISRLLALLMRNFGERVRSQLPVEPGERDAPDSLPIPDVVVTRDGEPAYRRRHPGAADVLLIAEVCDSTYHYDVKRKAHLYARAGFVEYIVLDLQDRELLVMQNPSGGIYTHIQVLRPGDTFRPLSAPEASISVSELLPEP